MTSKRAFDLIQTIRVLVAVVLLIMAALGSHWLVLVLPIALLLQVWKKSDCIYCKAGFCEEE
jgi:hypothetical protein